MTTIGYVIPAFPTRSETFISREVIGIAAARPPAALRVFTFKDPAPFLKQCEDAELISFCRKHVEYIDFQQGMTALLKLKWLRPKFMRFAAHLIKSSTNTPNRMLLMGRVAALAEACQRWQINHLHAHWPYASIVTGLTHQLAGVPFSVSIHAHEVAHENGHFKPIFDSLSFATFCNQAAMTHLLEQLPPEAANKSYLVRHGVNISQFLPKSVPPLSGPLHIVSAGRLTKTKGFDRLIRAVDAVRQRGYPIKLTILGEGAYRDALEALIYELGVADIVTLEGWVPHAEVAGRIEEAHLFALMANTNFHDGLPNVLLEAMACGRPVILSPLPSASEAVTHGVEGYILDHVDDCASFVRYIETFFKNPTLLTQMGAAAREQVATHHAEEDCLVRLDQLLS